MKRELADRLIAATFGAACAIGTLLIADRASNHVADFAGGPVPPILVQNYTQQPMTIGSGKATGTLTRTALGGEDDFSFEPFLGKSASLGVIEVGPADSPKFRIEISENAARFYNDCELSLQVAENAITLQPKVTRAQDGSLRIDAGPCR